MASIRERRGADGTVTFHVQIRMTGFPARHAAFRSRAAAQRWVKTIEASMIEGRHFRNVEARRRTVAEAIDRYLIEELPRKRNPGMHSSTLRWWKAELGKLRLFDVTPALLVAARNRLAREKFIRAKPGARRSSLKKGEQPKQYTRTASTVNRYLECLSHVFTICRKEWHWLEHNPMEGVSKLRPPPGRARYLNDDERTALLDATRADPVLHLLVVLALSTAARASDLLRLKWPDVDFKERRLLFRITKNAQPRAVWLHGEALRLLREHGKVRQLGTDLVFPATRGRGPYQYAEPFKAAREAAGIQDFRFHDLRHSAATYLAMMGASEQQLRAIGGWKSGVVSRYVHLAAKDSDRILKRMNDKILGK
ncbi:MAG: hypothetical protein AMXMBFR8_26800 [Nevskiales bacterium]